MKQFYENSTCKNFHGSAPKRQSNFYVGTRCKAFIYFLKLSPLWLLLAAMPPLSGSGQQQVETLEDGSTITTKPDGARHLQISNSVTSIGDGAFSGNKLTEVILTRELFTKIRNRIYSARIFSGFDTILYEFNSFGSITLYESKAGKKGKIIVRLDVNGAELKALETKSDGSTVATRKDGSIITTRKDGTRHLVIPDSVTSIGDRAFVFNEMTSVSIPASVTSIGDGAFAFNELTSVSIPPSVTSIGESAFGGNQLTEIILSVALYNYYISMFNNSPTSLNFYEYDASKPRKKGRRLN